MNKAEALAILEAKLDEYRGRSYPELRTRLRQDEHVGAVGPSGVEYQIEIQVFWDHKPEGDIRVSGSIDDGGWRAWVPLCRDFLVSPQAPSC